MIDKRLYRETFSQLCASDRAKQEVFQKMQELKHRKRLPRALRGATIAAAMALALAVTAGAVNVATDGALFQRFSIVWSSGDGRYLAEDDQGNQVRITVADDRLVTEEAGRLILHAGGEDIDITDDLEREGVYCYIYEMEVVRGDGSRELRPVTVNVTGTPEDWTATQDNGDGSCTTITSSDGRAPVGPG